MNTPRLFSPLPEKFAVGGGVNSCANINSGNLQNNNILTMKKDYSEDFLGWAGDCVKIVDKLSGASVPFVLNAPQRRVLAVLERQRLAGRPIRLIMLKARQWGGSVL